MELQGRRLRVAGYYENSYIRDLIECFMRVEGNEVCKKERR